MLTPEQIQEAVATDAELRDSEPVRFPGFRRVCMFCQCDLPGSDVCGEKVSHGMCYPVCDAAPAEWREAARKAMGEV